MRVSKRILLPAIFVTLFSLFFIYQRDAGARLVIEEEEQLAVGQILHYHNVGYFYTVVPGDTLWGIASYYGVSVPYLMEVNTHILNQHYIYPGQQVWIGSGTGGGQPTTPWACDFYHRVRYGDSLLGIAYRYNASPNAIMRWNNIVHADYIYAGQSLYIPCY